MKNTIQKLSAAKVSLVLVMSALVTLAISCSKSTSNPSFPGTYTGTLVESAYSETDTILITTGSTSSSVIMTSHTGYGSTYTISGTVNGGSLNIPSQQVYVASLSTTYTVTGSGILSGSNLAINYLFVSPTQVNYNWAFTGIKQ